LARLPQAVALQNTRRCALVRSRNHSVQSAPPHVTSDGSSCVTRRAIASAIGAISSRASVKCGRSMSSSRRLLVATSRRGFAREQLVQRRDLLVASPAQDLPANASIQLRAHSRTARPPQPHRLASQTSAPAARLHPGRVIPRPSSSRQRAPVADRLDRHAAGRVGAGIEIDRRVAGDEREGGGVSIMRGGYVTI
jgi:hypothetical protein